MYDQTFQRKISKEELPSSMKYPELEEKYHTPSDLDFKIYEAYFKEFLSLYQPSYDLEIQDLRSKIDVLMNQINTFSQVIQNLQNRKIIPIQNLRSTKLQLRCPLYVVSEYEDDVFVIFSDDINLYGYGDTELNAIRDFCKDVEYLYFDLKQSKEKLGEIMKENWEFLKNIIIEL